MNTLLGKLDLHSLRKLREIKIHYSKGMTKFQLAVKYGISVYEVKEITKNCKQIKAKGE